MSNLTFLTRNLEAGGAKKTLITSELPSVASVSNSKLVSTDFGHTLPVDVGSRPTSAMLSVVRDALLAWFRLG